MPYAAATRSTQVREGPGLLSPTTAAALPTGTLGRCAKLINFSVADRHVVSTSCSCCGSALRPRLLAQASRSRPAVLHGLRRSHDVKQRAWHVWLCVAHPWRAAGATAIQAACRLDLTSHTASHTAHARPTIQHQLNHTGHPTSYASSAAHSCWSQSNHLAPEHHPHLTPASTTHFTARSLYILVQTSQCSANHHCWVDAILGP
jgi:hypothetical protein